MTDKSLEESLLEAFRFAGIGYVQHTGGDKEARGTAEQFAAAARRLVGAELAQLENKVRAAEVVMDRIDVMVKKGLLSSRSTIADARLDYGEPFSERAAARRLLSFERLSEASVGSWFAGHYKEIACGALDETEWFAFVQGALWMQSALLGDSECGTCGGAKVSAEVEYGEVGMRHPIGEPCPDCAASQEQAEGDTNEV